MSAPETSLEYVQTLVSGDVKAQLEARAKQHERSLAAELRVAIRNHLADRPGGAAA